jgi:hypothetical protein
MTDREAMKMALDVLERASEAGYSIECEESIANLRQALARPKLTCATTQRAEAVAQKLRQRNSFVWAGLDREAVFAIDALVAFTKFLINRADTAQPEQDPVAWIGNANYVEGQFVEGRVRRVWWECNTGVGQPLYTTPPRKEWVGLTDGEMGSLVTQAREVPVEIPCDSFTTRLLKLAEQFFKEKNT